MNTKAPLLKPCPFCGNATAPTAVRTRVWWVACDDGEGGGCGASGPSSFRTRREASQAWNNRAWMPVRRTALTAYGRP
jgi:hypothetical protein